MSNQKLVPGSARCTLIRCENDKLYFVGIKDNRTYVAPVDSIIDHEISLNKEYLVSYFEHNKEIGSDDIVYLRKADIISREHLLSEIPI